MANMAGKEWPEWAAKRAKGNRLIAFALVALVVLYVALFVARYVMR